MGKAAKAHNKKIANRNLQIKAQKNRMNKLVKEFMLKKQIEEEKAKGLYDNAKPFTDTNISGDEQITIATS